jgi:hypothetical protein
MSATVYTPLPNGQRGVVSPHCIKPIWFSYLLHADGSVVGDSTQAHETREQAQARIDLMR